jgi:hypothetical protein
MLLQGGEPVNREELESALWQPMRTHRVTVREPARFIDGILRAADKYAAADVASRPALAEVTG